MIKQNRDSRNLGRAGAAAFLVFLAASLLVAISPDQRGDQRRQAMRESQIRAMDTFAQRYGDADWSLVVGPILANPGDAANPRIMSVFISLGNVYLTRFEERRAAEDIDRALGLFEDVAGHEELWGRRPFAGSVVAYLGVSVARLAGECDVSGYQGRIDELRRRVIEASGSEADAVAEAEIDAEKFVATTQEEDASRAALYAAAAVFQPEDPRAKDWGLYARLLALRLSSLESRSAETTVTLSQAAFLYEMSGGAIPTEIQQFFSAWPLEVAFRGRPSIVGARASEANVAIEPGDELETAVADSRFVAALLFNHLQQFRPGSRCGGDNEMLGPVPEMLSPAG
jgi:hypothetical protein